MPTPAERAARLRRWERVAVVVGGVSWALMVLLILALWGSDPRLLPPDLARLASGLMTVLAVTSLVPLAAAVAFQVRAVELEQRR